MTKTANQIACFFSALIVIFWFVERVFSPLILMQIVAFLVFPYCVWMSIVVSIGYAAYFYRKEGIKVFLPLMLLIIALFFRQPAAFLHMQASYFLHYNQRAEIIAQLEATPSLIEKYEIALPAEPARASKNGRIELLSKPPELSVQFEASSGAMSPYWFIIYSPDDRISIHGDYVETKQMNFGNNWYAVKCRPMTDRDRY